MDDLAAGDPQHALFYRPPTLFVTAPRPRPFAAVAPGTQVLVARRTAVDREVFCT